MSTEGRQLVDTGIICDCSRGRAVEGGWDWMPMISCVISPDPLIGPSILIYHFRYRSFGRRKDSKTGGVVRRRRSWHVFHFSGLVVVASNSKARGKVVGFWMTRQAPISLPTNHDVARSSDQVICRSLQLLNYR